MGKETRTTTANILINHIFHGHITFEEKNILLSTLPYIIECDLNPFPFKKYGDFFKLRPNQSLSYFQHIEQGRVDSFSNNPQHLTMMEQRNYSADSTMLMKENICVNKLKYDQAKVNASKKTIPV